MARGLADLFTGHADGPPIPCPVPAAPKKMPYFGEALTEAAPVKTSMWIANQECIYNPHMLV